MEDTTQNNSSSSVTRKLSDFFHQNKVEIDYRDADLLRKFLTPEGKILPGRRTGLSLKNQRKLTKAIKRARVIALAPFTTAD